ncbi:hypothetical protein EGH21_19585 [Halomicroarcula sp. F13]|uniref:Uncharacterized protein n=1 Tax=Haloarcula rubra TaxID=2487747 RepID=A0AAW4PVN0_9EURY|nr:hypothetical protein [Halomicroarcula rubra]MBX0325232.1 hypothetical protein [Halomicroarcula rubra]
MEYDVSAQSGAREGTYDLYSTVNGPGSSYSETLSVDVQVLEPRFGSVGTQTGEVTFTEDDTASTTVTADVENTGDGVMTGVDASTSGVPSGMSVSVSTPDEIGAGDTGSVEVDIDADGSLTEGSHSFTVEMTDSLGHTESFTVSIDVIKAPAVTAPDRQISLGDILVGESASTQFTLEEGGGYDNVDGVQISYDNDPRGTLSISGIGGYISAGGSEDGTATIDVDADARQHADINLGATFRPDDPDGTGTTISFSARVIYPPYYESVSAADRTIVFDEPRAQTDQFSTTVPVTIENGGDQPMQLTDVQPSVSGSDLTARVVDAPDSIPAQSSRTVDVRVTADSSADEGDRSMSVIVDAEQAGEETASSTVTIDHDTDLAVETSDVQYGRIVATRSVTRNVLISERLGYNDVQNFQISKVSGPDQGWLTVTERPESLTAGESTPFVTSLTFDTRAKFFTEYSWEYRITGDNIEAQTITITATPRPVDFTATVEDLQNAETAGDSRRQKVATQTAGAMETLATELREGGSQQARRDVTTVSAAGRSTVLFLQYTADARRQLDNGNHTAAQRSLTRAAATYNTLQTGSERVRTPDIRERMVTSSDAAGLILTDMLDEQRKYYQQRLDSNETTMLERAQTYRQLAQLAALADDDEQAARLTNQSRSAFREYSTLVSDGNADLQAARQSQANLTATTMLSIGGRPVFWIGNLDSVERQQAAVVGSYTQAEQQFESAGASSRAQTARTERAAFSQQMEQGRLLSFSLAGAVAIAFLVLLGLEARAIYRYVQDSTEAVSGDFLLAHDTT